MPEDKSISPENLEKNLVEKPNQTFEVPGQKQEATPRPESLNEMPQPMEIPQLDENLGSTEQVASDVPSGMISPQRKEEEKQVEKILEHEMEEIYKKLPDDKKQEFRIKGEETTRKIVDLIDKGKAKARDVMKLIIEWLKIIPGVNRFFIEQEAKIKTDEIMKINHN